jgi:hypothetical protein
MKNEKPSNIVEDERVFTTKEAAKYLGKSPRTLEGWRRNMGGPEYSKTGASKNAGVVYRKSKLDEYLDRYTYSSTSEYPK